MKSPYLTRRHRLIPQPNSLNKTPTPGCRWEKSYRNRRTLKQNVSVPVTETRYKRCEVNSFMVIDLGLQVLDEVIMTRWKVLPRDQCQGKIGYRHR